MIVSTEDKEIAAIAEAVGAEIRWRPPKLATDLSTLKDVYFALLDELEREGKRVEILCSLLATAPLRTADDIRRCYELVASGEADFSLAVTDYGHPPWQALKEDNGFLAPMWPSLIGLRHHEVSRLCLDNGSTYCLRVEAFRREKTFYGRRLKSHWMLPARSVNVDTAEDFELLQYYFERRNR